MKNYQVYNQTTPPIYDLKNVKVPAALFYGRGDILSGPEVRLLIIISLRTNTLHLEHIVNTNSIDKFNI